MSKIEIISSVTVKMSSDSDTAVSKLDLTPWDLQYLDSYPGRCCFLYSKPHQSHDFHATVVHHLQTTLSRALDFFPPLAGRLQTVEHQEDGTVSFFVNCNNQGAEFVHAIAHGVSVSDILGPTYVPEIVYRLLPLNGVLNRRGTAQPLLAVQVTELVDGFLIGYAMNHVVGDGNSFWHFFNSWSEISRGADVISKNPVFERWFPTGIERPIRVRSRNPPGDQTVVSASANNLLSRVFHFSKENIAELKSRAISEVGNEKISSLQSLLAHLWRSMVRARQKCTQNEEDQTIFFILLVGARERTGLSDAYFGNAVYAARCVSYKQEVLNHGLGWAALKLNELVARQTYEKAIRFLEDWQKYRTIQNSNLPADFNVCVVSSSPRFDVYGNDFGWGKPIAVRNGLGFKFDGRITVYPAPDAGGIDAEICLSQQTMHAMEEEILSPPNQE